MTTAPTTSLTGVDTTVEEIDPDIRCAIEGPKGEQGAKDFRRDVLGAGYQPVLSEHNDGGTANSDADYETRGTPARHGWVGVYLDAGPVDWDELEGMMALAYRLTAPKKLLATLG